MVAAKPSARLWNSPGGNPGGYISGALSSNSSDLLYGFEPTDLTPYGNLTGLTLTTDFQISGQVTGPSPANVRFYVGDYANGQNNYFVTTNAYSWDPNADTSWTTHTVALLAANFETWPNQNAGTLSFAQVIAAPQDIGLVFTDDFTANSQLGFTGSGAIGVDNFGTVVPEPSSLALLFSAGLGMLAYAWRRGKAT